MPDVPERLAEALTDRYALERELGRGGMATVYLARDRKHDRAVALKVLRPELASALGPGRFQREIAITAGLHHPHILPLLDSGEADGQPFYVMPFVEGESLRDRLDREQQLPLEEALQIAREVAEALSYAHSRGVIHRDIKPENVLLESGRAIVADFGIAKAVTDAGGAKLTETGLAIGTPAYMSPEQAEAARPVDGRSDLYSLGCVLYEMLAGHAPFQGNTAHELIVRHAADPVPPLRAARGLVPEGVEAAIERVLAKAPADRFATAQEFSEALQRAATAGAGHRTRRRFGRVAAAVGVLAVALATAAAWFTWTGRPGTLLATGTVEPGGRVLLADFTNLTDDTTLGYAVREGIRALLSDPRLVRLVDPADVRATLERMGLPPDTELEDAVAREVAEREGAKVFVTGEVSRLGAGYQFTASVVQASDGIVLLRERVTARDLEGVIDAVDRLGGRLRRGIGESVQHALARQALDRVTTSSLPALRAYSEATKLRRAGRDREACALLDRAIEEDSGFAMAYRLRGVIEGNLVGGSRTESLRLLERAYRLRDRLPELERLTVTATYFADQRDPRRESALQAILSLDPNDEWALSNLSDLRLGQRRFAEAESFALRAIAVSSQPGAGYWNAVQAQVEQNRLAAAESTLQQLAGSSPSSWWMVRGHYLLARREYRTVLALADSLQAVPGFESIASDHMVLAALLARGRLAEARIRPPRSIQVALRYLGDTARARAEIDAERRRLRWDTLPPALRPNEWLIPTVAEAGFTAEARRLLGEYLHAAETDSALALDLPAIRPAVEGAVAMAEGRFEDAARYYLDWNTAPFLNPDVYVYNQGLFEAGAALDQLGKTDSAIVLYERALSLSAMGAEFSEVLWYPLALRRLGELYDARGQRDKALDYYGRFADLWKDADPELQPQVTAVRRRMTQMMAEPR